MKSLVGGMLLAALAALVCPANGLGQTDDETATSGATKARKLPAHEEPLDDPFDEPVEEPVYDSSKPIPAGYVLEKRPHPALLIPGGAALGLSYAYGLFFAIRERQDPDHAMIGPGWMLIPVLGPFIAAATAHESCGTTGSGSGRDTYCQPPYRDGLAVLGGIQAFGLALTAVSYVAPRKRLVRAQVTVAPVPIGLGGYGLSLSGRL